MSGTNLDDPPDRKGDGLYSQAAAAAATYARAGGGDGANDVRLRSFAEIIADEQANRNILEIHVYRMKTIVNSTETKFKSLTFDDLGELVFDVLNVDPALCLGFNYSAGRYDTKEIKFKPGVDISTYIKTSFEFKGHEVSTNKQANNLTKISFRNVPFSVPDEEIIQLCRCYGTPLNNKVHYEKMFNKKNKGMMGGTRWVEMELKQGMCMNNFYWLEGPLPGDTGSRITVLHGGQEQQCSHCLRTGRGGCRAMGNGKACEQLKTARVKMADYMTNMKKTVGYESLKSLYLQQYPYLQAENKSNMEERISGEDDEEDLFHSNPIARRDEKIAELEKTVADIPVLKEAIVKMRAEKKKAVGTALNAKRKLNLARKVTEERLKECLPVPSFENEHSQVLIMLMSTLIDDDSFELDPDTDTLSPRADIFKDIEDSCAKEEGGEVMRERLEVVKNKLVERVRESAVRSRKRKSFFRISE